MTIISLPDAQANLTALVRGLSPGQEIIITDNDRAVARLALPEDEVSPVPVSNAYLLETGKMQRPPQAWYEGDEENLF
jgi:antitoxin (DNA-binding transcriptional repressor) of toxin-antitoxin stability system